MATAPRKIDSSAVELSFANEESPGTLPISGVVWQGVEANGYGPSGADVKSTPRKTLGNRRRQKGRVTGLDANLEFGDDLTFLSFQNRLPNLLASAFVETAIEAVTAVTAGVGNGYTVASTTGFNLGSLIKGWNFDQDANNAMNLVTAIGGGQIDVGDNLLVADAAPPANAFIRNVGQQAAAGDISVVAVGDFFAIQTVALDFTTLPFVAGGFVFVGGDGAAFQFATAANNGLKRIRSISTTQLLIDKSDVEMVADAGAGKTIRLWFGRYIRDAKLNPTDQFERKLGIPDITQPTQIQRQYFKGSVWDEAEIEWPEEDIVGINSTYLCFDVENSVAPHTPKPGDRPTMPAEEAFSTTIDFKGLRLAVIDPTTAAPTDLFVYIVDMTMNIINNCTINKSLKVLGGFDVTRGTFEVDCEMNPYFTSLGQQIAIRESSDTTLHGFIVNVNAGMVFDCPTGTITGGLLEIEEDEAVKSPITFGASDARKVSTFFDYTIHWQFFDYLPNLAHPSS